MSERRETVPAGPATATVAAADVARIWAVMSHEIRTPLMGVVGMLDVLNRTNLTDEQRRIIGTAEQSSVTLMHIIDDVLDFAKLESTQIKLEKAPAEPLAIIEGTADLLANIIGAKPLRLTCEAVGNLPAIACDALRLRQILVNIGTNAVKYTESGSVALSVAKIGEGENGVTLRFSVADTGQGIPVELQGYLFEPFWQVAGRESGGMGGVGLGLAICRTLVDAMGGRVSVESDAGRGTRFDIDITFQRAGAQADAPRLDDIEVITVDTGEADLAIALRYLAQAGAKIVRVDNLGALGRSGSAEKRTVILIGAEAEAEDVEATAAALQRMGSAHVSSIVWLHKGAAGSLPARSGVWPVRANPMRRSDLFAAVQRVGGAREGDGFAVVARHQERYVDPLDAVQAARADGLVILVAEDNKVNQEVLRQQLAILGYDCDIAGNGQAALKALGERRYPLLLCDCHMPGMDGFELTRLIRTNEGSGPRIPIIAVTANAVPGEAARCRAAGMDDYLAKPIEIGSLQAKLNQWLGPAHAAAREARHAAPGPSEPRERVLDLRNLLVVYGNDPQRLAPVIQQWARAMSDLLPELDSAIAASEWAAALAMTHRLKGNAGVAGAPRLSAAAAALDVALRAQVRADIAREFAQLRTLAAAGIDEAGSWVATATGQAAVLEKAESSARI